MTVFDATPCDLGEGPLWHPERQSLFWFDILGKRLFERDLKGAIRRWQFDLHHSAAGWVDRNTLLIASETALSRFDINSGEARQVASLEADNPITRSNDGRADPWGGFWIGTMGKQAERGAGTIYRFYKGELRSIVGDITVSNAICFAPDKSCAYYTDTVRRRIMRQPLGAEGWPAGDPAVHIDLREAELNPDGAVTDAEGNIWCAMWDASCVICFNRDGTELRRIDLPARRPTCPAFGGPDLRDLYITSATHGLPADESLQDGQTFVLQDVAQGLPEPRVAL